MTLTSFDMSTTRIIDVMFVFFNRRVIHCTWRKKMSNKEISTIDKSLKQFVDKWETNRNSYCTVFIEEKMLQCFVSYLQYKVLSEGNGFQKKKRLYK